MKLFMKLLFILKDLKVFLNLACVKGSAKIELNLF